MELRYACLLLAADGRGAPRLHHRSLRLLRTRDRRERERERDDSCGMTNVRRFSLARFQDFSFSLPRREIDFTRDFPSPSFFFDPSLPLCLSVPRFLLPPALHPPLLFPHSLVGTALAKQVTLSLPHGVRTTSSLESFFDVRDATATVAAMERVVSFAYEQLLITRQESSLFRHTHARRHLQLPLGAQIRRDIPAGEEIFDYDCSAVASLLRQVTATFAPRWREISFAVRMISASRVIIDNWAVAQKIETCKSADVANISESVHSSTILP